MCVFDVLLYLHWYGRSCTYCRERQEIDLGYKSSILALSTLLFQMWSLTELGALCLKLDNLARRLSATWSVVVTALG